MRKSDNTARIFESNSGEPRAIPTCRRNRSYRESDRTRCGPECSDVEHKVYCDGGAQFEANQQVHGPTRTMCDTRFGNVSYRDAVCALCEKTVSLALSIPLDNLQAPTRCTAEAAHARQIAMYLCHTTFSLLLTEIGIHFGRDRTTVSYACALVEDRRDEPDFDILLCQLESLLLDARNAMTLLTVPLDGGFVDMMCSCALRDNYSNECCCVPGEGCMR